MVFCVCHIRPRYHAVYGVGMLAWWNTGLCYLLKGKAKGKSHAEGVLKVFYTRQVQSRNYHPGSCKEGMFHKSSKYALGTRGTSRRGLCGLV